MPDFEQNKGTNLKLKRASRSGTERSEILNNDSKQHIKTLFNESSPLVACNRCYTAICQFYNGIRAQSARRSKTERLESLKSFSKHNSQNYCSGSFPPVASERCYVAPSDLDFELNKNSD